MRGWGKPELAHCWVSCSLLQRFCYTGDEARHHWFHHALGVCSGVQTALERSVCRSPQGLVRHLAAMKLLEIGAPPDIIENSTVLVDSAPHIRDVIPSGPATGACRAMRGPRERADQDSACQKRATIDASGRIKLHFGRDLFSPNSAPNAEKSRL